MATNEQIDAILKAIGVYPTSAQHPILYSKQRQVLVAGGERSGKSAVGADYLTTRMHEGRLFWLVAANYNLTRPEFEYVCRNLERLGYSFTHTKQVDPGQIEVLDSKGRLVFNIVTKSSNDPRTLAAEAPDGILVCEASQLDYESYLRLRGRIAEKRGWLFMGGTFESSLGWYPELWERGQAPPASEDDLVSYSMPSWSNTFVYPGGREDPEIKAMETEFSTDWFNERLGGTPCPPKGRVFDEFSTSLHVGAGEAYDFHPTELVHIMIDPGFASAYTVLAAHQQGDKLVVFDEIFERGLVTSEIIKITKQRPWWNRVVSGAIDIAAKQHQAMPAPIEVWLKEAGIYLRSQRLSIRDGIEQIKRFLIINPKTGQSLLRINSRCKGLISEFGGCPSPITNQTGVYRWKTDKDGNVLGDTPDDRNNHAIKALSYGLVDLFGFSPVTTQRAKIKFF
uniref:Putative terminase n=1 Tax=viral metagenome TaxID=1070528 RepID=A0A6H1ZI18_9ZZZZ